MCSDRFGRIKLCCLLSGEKSSQYTCKGNNEYIPENTQRDKTKCKGPVIKEDKKRLRKVIEETGDILNLSGIMLTIFLFLASDQIILILGGAAFIEAALVLKILAFVLLIRFLSYGFRTYAIANNKEQAVSFIYLISLIVVITLSYLLIDRFSTVGAAWALLAAEAIAGLAILILSRKELIKSGWLINLIKKLPLTGLITLVVYLIVSNPYLSLERFGSYSIITELLLITIIFLITALPIILKIKKRFFR